MANERAWMYRNTGTTETPVWEKWFQKTVADAVYMDEMGEKNIIEYLQDKIDELIGGAPGTYDTLKEIADYIEAHEDIATALNEAIANKADKEHTHSGYANQNAFSNVVVGNTTIAADTTMDSLTLAGSNVTITPDTTNDKVTIGITKDNVVSALGYTPPTTNTTYGVATSSAFGLVKSGTDITVDASGNVSVNDDSHNHVITNVDGLQSALNEKADSSHTHSEYAASSHAHSAVTTSASGFMSAADKVKLDGIATGANKYAHPSTHAASMITQDATHRFVTDAEKEVWDAKAEIYFASSLPSSAAVGAICFLTE